MYQYTNMSLVTMANYMNISSLKKKRIFMFFGSIVKVKHGKFEFVVAGGINLSLVR